MLRHSQHNAAAFALLGKKIFEVRTFNAAAFSVQYRGIQTLWRNRSEVWDLNAAAFSHECRGIRSQTQKNKTAHSRVLFIFPLFFLNHSNTLKLTLTYLKIPKPPNLQSTKFISQTFKSIIPKTTFFQLIYKKLIQKDLLVGRKSLKLLLLGILFKPSKCSCFWILRRD